MNIPISPSNLLAILCVLALAASPKAVGEPAPEGNAKVLLDEARKKQADRKRAELKKELDRFAEDVKKGDQEVGELEAGMSKVNHAVSEAKGQIDRLEGRKKRVIQDMELLPLRIEAERLKAEALNLLNAAHSKAAEALRKRNEELDLRAALVTAQIHKLEDAEIGAEPGARSTAGATTTELRKNLQKAGERSAAAVERARETMDAASAKFRQAEAASAKADKKQAEIEQSMVPAAPGATEPGKPKKSR